MQLHSPSATLLDFSRKKIPVLGLFQAEVMHRTRAASVGFYVTRSGTSLLGLDAVQALGLQILGTELWCLNTAIEPIFETPADFEAHTGPGNQESKQPQTTAGNSQVGLPKFGMPAMLWAKFAHLASPGLGLARGVQHKMKLREQVAPVAQKLRRLPFSVRKSVSKELKRLLAADVIERVNASEWCHE